MERNTRQRDALRDAFERAGRPLSAQEAHTLDVVELPGEPPRYEKRGLGHHHHFRCRTCERVFDVPGCAIPAPAALPRGFRLESHDVCYSGVCAACVV